MAKSSDFNETFNVNDKSFFAPNSMVDAIRNYYVKNGKQPPVTVADICRAIFVSLAKSYGETLKGISTIIGKQFDALHIIGGGSQNQLLNELTAKEIGIKVVSGPTEATAIGNILVQLKYQSVISSLKEGKKLIKNSFDVKEIKYV